MPTDAAVVSPVPAAAGLPRIEPVPLIPRSDAFDHPGWLFEPKYDGFRALLFSSEHGCQIELAGEVVDLFQDLQHRVAEVLRSREAILDGEVVALDRKGKPVLQHLLRGEGYLAFAAYDLVWLDGSDLRDQPLHMRKEHLTELLPEDSGPLYKVLTIEEHGRALFGAISKMDLGGIVAKRREDPYHPATVWYEVRNPSHTAAADPWVNSRRQPTRPRIPSREP